MQGSGFRVQGVGYSVYPFPSRDGTSTGSAQQRLYPLQATPNLGSRLSGEIRLGFRGYLNMLLQFPSGPHMARVCYAPLLCFRISDVAGSRRANCVTP